MDQEIEFDKDSRAPHHPLHQLSATELEVAISYLDDFRCRGSIISSKSPYGASLFFGNEKENTLRGPTDYRVFRKNGPLRRSDEIFEMIGKAQFISKLDLKTGFDHIRVQLEDIEKIALNRNYHPLKDFVMQMRLSDASANFTVNNEP